MSSISRYQKAGGFIQLVQLIETCGKQKQDSFLTMIEKEDGRWAEAIKQKMLTMERILSWDNSVLAEIAARLPQLTLAFIAHGLKAEDETRLLETFSHSQRRAIEDLKNSKTPTPAEISSSAIKVIQEVRSMIMRNDIRLEKVAPTMIIDKNIEDNLSKSAASGPVTNKEETAPDEASNVTAIRTAKGVVAVKDTPEYITLSNKFQQIQTENNNLKSEVKILRDKLAQIKKIA